MSLEEYLNQLEREIDVRNEAIQNTKRNTDAILRQANQQVIEQPEQIVLTDQPEPLKQAKQQQPKTQEDANYQKQIQEMAKQMAVRGVDPTVAEKLGPDAELQYLKSRVQNLEQLVQQQNGEHQKLLQSTAEGRETLQLTLLARDKLQKQANIQGQRIISLQKENEQNLNKVAVLQQQLQDIQNKTESATKVAQNGITANQQKEKQIGRLIDQIEVLKKQLNESVEREVLLKQKFDEGNTGVMQEKKKQERERDELQSIIKKQQQLIDVLQRQKLHLQGAISLGFSEAEFQKILDK